MIRNLMRREGHGENVPAGNIGGPFDDLHRQMDSLISGFFGGHELPIRTESGAGFVNPSFEVAETDTEFNVTAELPGLTEKDVEINLEENILTIKGEKKEEKNEKKKNYHLYERRYGSFQRSFSLPQNSDADKINASVKNGVLEIKIPKKEPSKAKNKKIEVKAK
ncbi:MAG TPA: Hsp20/alpha crystallin family protein [Victivallales bacterium]|nr:Hsp20/alpha crystallin family protein [Victivallales bacterium]